MTDLFNSKWHLDDLDFSSFGEFAFDIPSDKQKHELWYPACESKKRVPVTIDTNERIAILDERFNYGLNFKDVFEKPEIMLRAHLMHQYLRRKRYNLFCDLPCELPGQWEVTITFQNIYEAQFLGSPIHYRSRQIPDTEPWLDDDNKCAVFEIDISQPLQRPPFSTAIEYHEFMCEYVKDKTFLSRPIKILPPLFLGCDGPLTVAMNIRGEQILFDMFDDPDYADELFDFIVQAAINRIKAVKDYYDQPENTFAGFADDSIAMIGTQQYEDQILKHHKKYYDEVAAPFGRRAIHLCGDATRHFSTINRKLGVVSFDTGFPVNFAQLRKQLGPDVIIKGGVEVSILCEGTPQQVYDRAKEILSSGVAAGGNFIFRDANNLPPNVPWTNLAAFYKAALDFG